MAGSRLLVARDVHDALVDRIVARAEAIKIGGPAAPETEMGPLANEAQYEKVLSFFASAADQGATDQRLPGRGAECPVRRLRPVRHGPRERPGSGA
jgi:acyl-CoA reductase-like NAD-dependent aldehyde dehydrogenase